MNTAAQTLHVVKNYIHVSLLVTYSACVTLNFRIIILLSTKENLIFYCMSVLILLSLLGIN